MAIENERVTDTGYLEGFNFIEYLERRRMLGQLYPVDRRRPIVPISGLLVSLSTAYDECMSWCKQGHIIPQYRFKEYLEDNMIFTGDLNEFQKGKAKADKGERMSITQKTMRLYELADALNVSRRTVQADKIKGRQGTIYVNDPDPYWSLKISLPTKRAHSGMCRRLGFMEALSYDGQVGEFTLDRLPRELEAEYIRRAVGLNRKPALTEDHRKALPSRFNKAEEQIAA